MREKHTTGIWGLDDILYGGLPAGHLYLVKGEPGTGKTTLALSFLTAHENKEETTLYVTLSESSDELKMVADAHQFNLDHVQIIELERDFNKQAASQYTVFESTEVELDDTLTRIYGAAEKIMPKRVVIDSLSELRLLVRDPLRFRRELLSLKHNFSKMGATLLLLDDLTIDSHEGLIESIAHGVISLERLAMNYGGERRRIIVSKLRGIKFREGYHDYRIETGGLEVYPRLIASEHRITTIPGQMETDSENLNTLLGGGLDRGTSTILLGPSGVGKSTLCAKFVAAMAGQDDKVEILLFDENLGTYLAREKGLNIGLSQYLDSGHIRIRQIDPGEVSPGELTHMVRESVERNGAKGLIIDSINGLIQAMPEERTLIVQMHQMLSYLGQQNITTILTLAQHGTIGSETSEADLSYLADTLMLLRYFEAFGEIRRSVSVIKKRTGAHAAGLHELRFAPGGLVIGDQLSDFQGILTGTPRFLGREERLFDAPRG